MVVLDAQVSAVARGVSGCAVGGCWVSGGGLGRLLRAKATSQAILATLAEGLSAEDTDTLVGVQERLAELVVSLGSITEEA